MDYEALVTSKYIGTHVTEEAYNQVQSEVVRLNNERPAGTRKITASEVMRRALAFYMAKNFAHDKK